jgi:hypothetical protein
MLVLRCGDHEPLLSESPLKARGLATEQLVEHIPCGSGRKDIHTSIDWMDRYMTYMDVL